MSTDPVQPDRVLIVCVPCRLAVVLGDREDATTGSTEAINAPLNHPQPAPRAIDLTDLWSYR